MAQPIRVVYMGTAGFACPSLAALDNSPGTKVIGVVTQPDRPKGRQLIPHPPAVKVEAESRKLTVHQPLRIRNDFNFLYQLNPDLIVVAAYGQILPETILDLPKQGCINVHGSLLPLYRGAAPIQRAILDGQNETGVTIMEMEAGMDTGPMISKIKTPIETGDNAQTLHDRLANLGAKLLVETIPQYVSGKIKPTPQDESQATHAPKITRDMGQIDWSKTATEIWNQARAFTPWPGIFTHISDKLLKIIDVEPVDINDLEPGIIGKSNYEGIIVGCGKKALRIKQLQKEGGKRLAANAFLAGHPLPAGTQLG
ncbi:MAG: methionyl-tRNA formyltransferase [Verrucomicrobiota bacterium]|nr:methionyl-tRNA formyltransferase [Verrucomicrobiota bacterium]